MADLSVLAPLTTAATALSNLVLVSPQNTVGYQPQNKPSNSGQTPTQPPAILFHYEGDQDVQVQSDITDHWVEDNTAIQDQIALKPVEVSVHGFIGELNNVAPYGLQTLQQLASKLGAISAYAPAVSVTALIAYNEAFFLYQVGANAVNSAISTWATINGAGKQNGGQTVINGNSINGSTVNGSTDINAAIARVKSQTKQQVVFQQFWGYWNQRTLFTVQTPWAVFQNMAIKSMRAVQDARTRTITDFHMTFKQIRTANTDTLNQDGPVRQERNALQSAGPTNLGVSTPVDSIGSSSAISNNYPGVFTGT